MQPNLQWKAKFTFMQINGPASALGGGSRLHLYQSLHSYLWAISSPNFFRYHERKTLPYKIMLYGCLILMAFHDLVYLQILHYAKNHPLLSVVCQQFRQLAEKTFFNTKGCCRHLRTSDEYDVSPGCISFH